MNRTSGLIKNYIAQFFLQLSLIVVGLILTKFIIVTYGSEVNGLIVSINQFISYLSLVEAGIGGATIYSLYMPLAKKDNNKISSIFTTADKLYYQSGAIFLVLLFVMIIIYPLVVSANIMTKTEIALFFFILGIPEMFNFFLMSKYRSLLTADKKNHIISFAGMALVYCNAIIIIYLASIGLSVILAKAFAIAAILLQAFILIRYCKVKYSYLNYNAPTNKNMIRQRGDVLSIQILTGVHHGLPIVLVTLFISLSELSVYSIYNLLFLAIGGIVSIFSNIIVPFFGELLANKDAYKFQEIYKKFEVAFFMILAFVYICTIFLAQPFIEIYTQNMADANYDRPMLITLFIILGITNYIKAPCGVIMQSSGLFKVTRNQWVVQTIVALILGVLFIQEWGLSGVLMAIIVSNLYRDFALISYVSKKIDGIKVGETLKHILTLIACICLAFMLHSYITIDVSTYISLLTMSVIVAICSLISVLLIFYLTSKEEVVYIIRKLLMIFNYINITRGMNK
jgi:O-antigen/teichoic acid export membrane protein